MSKIQIWHTKTRKVPCVACNGHKKVSRQRYDWITHDLVYFEDDCQVCKGTGQIEEAYREYADEGTT